MYSSGWGWWWGQKQSYYGMVKDFVFTHLNRNSFKLFRDPVYIRNKHSKEGKISDADLRVPADSQYSSITA